MRMAVAREMSVAVGLINQRSETMVRRVRPNHMPAAMNTAAMNTAMPPMQKLP